MLKINLFLALITEEIEKNRFELIYTQYVRLLLKVANDRLNDSHLAEDAVSDTFLYLARNMDKIEEPVSNRTKALLLTVIKHIMIDMERKHFRKKEILTEPIKLQEIEELFCSTDSMVNQLADAIEQLPMQYQNVILLKYAEGYSNKEIAELLNYTKSNVDKLVTRGKKKLQMILREMEQNEV